MHTVQSDEAPALPCETLYRLPQMTNSSSRAIVTRPEMDALAWRFADDEMLSPPA
jgi:hypothetical protein